MLRIVRAVRPALPTRAVAASSSTRALRAFSTTPARAADDHHGTPQLYGSGAKDPLGIPSDEEQATGIERLQLLGRMEGVDVFDMQPLDSSRIGTVKEPIMVPTLMPERIVGCTGFPVESHDTLWLALDTKREHHRCPECGSVYKLDYQGGGEELHHH